MKKPDVIARYFVIIPMLTIITLSIFADEYFIPDWFYESHQYWRNGLVSDREFVDAISYLQKIDLLRIKNSSDEPIMRFLVTAAIIKQDQLGNSRFSDCTGGWHITGYYTPLETDYVGKLITINVDETVYELREDFVADLKIEGWGKTISGRYVGWYDDSFHLSDLPRDANGDNLFVGVIAIDQSVIPANSNVTIPSLPPPWNGLVFVGSDVGQNIVGKHIDVYTGEGRKALNETYTITGHNNVVCMEVD
ncbi:MAG: 3D domain-containing protein [Candidatus Nitrosotenuis sp.]